MSVHETTHASPARIALGFAAVYILWGSTYLGIRFAVASIPPLLMAGTRYVLAGLLLYAIVRRVGAAKPTRIHWRSATLLGALLLLGGNGLVSIAEQAVPSGITALLVAAVPFWMVLLNAMEKRTLPRLSVIGGLLLGILGLTVLVLPSGSAAADHVDPQGVVLLLVGSFSWAMGSLYAHRAPLPASTFLGIAMEMIAGGLLLWIVGCLTGEGAILHLQGITQKSFLALGYLVIFGSLLGFSAYVWLLKVTTPARASTYAFVNPVIAVLLGWALAGEALTPRVALAGGIIVAAVCLIMYFGATAKAKASPASTAASEET
ncbi:MAG TPA: EamA family transporter [Gammaproteobacteria bacterium]|jgi:drug/metabolite transporter (DMT)-like permease|nr:EamA family transporter [Gammaproteobacteria bacterium]